MNLWALARPTVPAVAESALDTVCQSALFFRSFPLRCRGLYQPHFTLWELGTLFHSHSPQIPWIRYPGVVHVYLRYPPRASGMWEATAALDQPRCLHFQDLLSVNHPVGRVPASVFHVHPWTFTKDGQMAPHGNLPVGLGVRAIQC